MGLRATRLALFALAAFAVTAAGCHRSPVAGRSGDAGGETIGAPSVGDAAREPLDAAVETLPDASPDAGLDTSDTSNASDTGNASDTDDTGDAATADAPVDQANGGDGPADVTSADLFADVAQGDAPDDAPMADAPLDVAAPDAPANSDAPPDRMLGDSSDVRPEDQPCGPQGFICAPFACDVARGTCKNSCVTNADCVTGKMCNPVGLCGFKEDVACSSNDECRSGHCAQGVCCATACGGSCRSCALPGSLGTCAPVPRGALDPIGACGAGGTCNGQGGCVPATCVADADCGDAYWCTAGHCVPCTATCTSAAVCTPPAVCIMRNFCTHCGLPDGGTGL